MSSIEPGVIERMQDLVKRFALYGAHGSKETPLYFTAKDFDEFREVAAVLPEPIDTDIAEARKVVGESYGRTRYYGIGDLLHGDGPRRVEDIVGGRGDGYWEAKAVLAGIKRGRELGSLGHGMRKA